MHILSFTGGFLAGFLATAGVVFVCMIAGLVISKKIGDKLTAKDAEGE